MQFTVTEPIHDAEIEAMLADVCHILHDADPHVERLDVTQELDRDDIAPTIKRAKAIAREWNLDVFAAIHGRQLRLAFVRHVQRR